MSVIRTNILVKADEQGGVCMFDFDLYAFIQIRDQN